MLALISAINHSPFLSVLIICFILLGGASLIHCTRHLNNISKRVCCCAHAFTFFGCLPLQIINLSPHWSVSARAS